MGQVKLGYCIADSNFLLYISEHLTGLDTMDGFGMDQEMH
jgi:hypothetical protein